MLVTEYAKNVSEFQIDSLKVERAEDAWRLIAGKIKAVAEAPPY
ncbi:hypothetical protein U9J35_04190 [Rossellomorea aquimaris]|nr:hypothetical protein [Rossellomorea aquimaris]WRP07375.1 hypothetical protein U9J35_04190 [Rossellomorea aquimaris]